jgi:hypothetical protein
MRLLTPDFAAAIVNPYEDLLKAIAEGTLKPGTNGLYAAKLLHFDKDTVAGALRVRYLERIIVGRQSPSDDVYVHAYIMLASFSPVINRRVERRRLKDEWASYVASFDTFDREVIRDAHGTNQPTSQSSPAVFDWKRNLFDQTEPGPHTWRTALEELRGFSVERAERIARGYFSVLSDEDEQDADITQYLRPESILPADKVTVSKAIRVYYLVKFILDDDIAADDAYMTAYDSLALFAPDEEAHRVREYMAGMGQNKESGATPSLRPGIRDIWPEQTQRMRDWSDYVDSFQSIDSTLAREVIDANMYDFSDLITEVELTPAESPPLAEKPAEVTMRQHKTGREEMAFSVMARLVAVGMLATPVLEATDPFHLFSAWDLHHDFYTLLRWFVFGITAITAWAAYKAERQVWVHTMIALALLFNPILPFGFQKATWLVIDSIAAATCLLSIALFRPSRQRAAEDEPVTEKRRFSAERKKVIRQKLAEQAGAVFWALVFAVIMIGSYVRHARIVMSGYSTTAYLVRTGTDEIEKEDDRGNVRSVEAPFAEYAFSVPVQGAIKVQIPNDTETPRPSISVTYDPADPNSNITPSVTTTEERVQSLLFGKWFELLGGVCCVGIPIWLVVATIRGTRHLDT